VSESTIIKKPVEIKITCECGENVTFNFGDWKVNIVGLIEFRCPKCNRIYRTKGLWET